MATDAERIAAKSVNKVAKKVNKVQMSDFLHDNYLPYAYYVIRNRALVGVDGLKPVNRRILYDMYVNKIFPSSTEVKANTIVGDVIGKFHPHGPSGVSGGLAHMAQKFNTRVPLIAAHGEVGLSTGDRAAADRYWEAKLTKPAMELLKELQYKALPLAPSFDESREEPMVLPVRWPSTIINGTEGIAVGYASKIFPSNPDEVMDVAIEMLKNPDMTVDEIMKIMPGPDFPTGGELIGVDGIKDMYETGKGTFKVRGKYKTSTLSRGRTEISFYELPFHVSAEQVSERIKKLKSEGKLKEISSFKDLSGRGIPVKYNITLKSGSNVLLVIKDLFSNTPLETKFTSNSIVLKNGAPVLSGIVDLFKQFLELRETCTINRSQVQLDKDKEDAHRLEGLATILLDIDKAVEIIRGADTSEQANEELQTEFKIDEEQANNILSMQLRRLTKADRNEIQEKVAALHKDIDKITAMLADPEKIKAQIIEDLEDTKKIISDPRRTTIVNKTADDIKAEEKSAQKEIKAMHSSKSIKFVQLGDGSLYKSLDMPVNEVKLPVRDTFEIAADDDLFAVMRDGTGIRIPASYIPFDKKSDLSVLGLPNPDDVVSFGKFNSSRKDYGLLVFTTDGRVNLMNSKVSDSNKEFEIIQLEGDQKIAFAKWISQSDAKKSILAITSDGYGLRTSANLRVSSYGTKGVAGMKVSDGAKVVGAMLVDDKDVIVSLTSSSIKSTAVSDFSEKGRGGKGMILQKLSKQSGLEITSVYGGPDVLITDKLGNEMSVPGVTDRARAGFKFPTLGFVMGTNIQSFSDITDNAN